MPYNRPTDPSSVLGVLVDGFSLYRASIRSLYVTVFWLGLVFGLIHWGEIPFRRVGEEISLGVGYWLRQAVSLVANAYMYGVILAIVHYVASGAPPGVRSPLVIATRRFPALLAVFLLYGLAITMGPVLVMILFVLVGTLFSPDQAPLVGIFVSALILLMLVPVIFMAVTLFASFLLAITEGYGPINSLRESYAMVRGYWWATFAVIATATAISTAMSLAINEITLFLANLFDSNTMSNAIATLAYAAFLAIIAPLSVCLFYAAYQDLRLRQNGVASA